MKVIRAGTLTYEAGFFGLDGWTFEQDGQGDTLGTTGMINAALEYILEERITTLRAIDDHEAAGTLNAERIMIDAIQQAKK